MTLTPLEPWIAEKTGCHPLTRSGLECWQLRRLSETIAHAREHSPLYREKLKNCGPVESVSGLANLPFTTADELSAGAQRFLCASQSEFQRVVTLPTSGTTGKPKRLYFTPADIESTMGFFAAGMSAFTKPGDRVLILLPGEVPDSAGSMLARALERIGAAGIIHGPVSDAFHTLALMRGKNITGVVGTPVQVLGLARAPDSRALAIGSVVLTSDYVPDSLCRAVEQAWDCRVYHHYGMTEMGLGGGVDCVERQGYHLREADLYFEIIDPVSGAPVPDGQAGEIVFTTLCRTGMPLIRYRTGDLARMRPQGCSCGTLLRCMEHVRGRIGRGIVLGNGISLQLPDLDEALFAVDGLLNFRAEAVCGPGTCRLRLHVSAAPGSQACYEQAIRQALHSDHVLQGAFADGSLVLEPLRYCAPAWLDTGQAKRTLGSSR
jgi:phenylacetate-CoA ligase